MKCSEKWKREGNRKGGTLHCQGGGTVMHAQNECPWVGALSSAARGNSKDD